MRSKTILSSISLAALSLFIVAPASIASSYYNYSKNTIKFVQDNDASTYFDDNFNANCKVKLFYDKANKQPLKIPTYNTGYTETTILGVDYSNDYSTSLKQTAIQSIESRIQEWLDLPTGKKIARVHPAKQSDFSKCLLNAEARHKEAIATQERKKAEEELCFNQGKKFHHTSRGRLCLSDYEYAQILHSEENLRQQRYMLQEQQRYRAEERRRANARALGAALGGLSDSIRKFNEPKSTTCYGNYTRPGMFTSGTYQTTCY